MERKKRDKHFIRIGKQLIAVTEEVYQAYYSMQRHERYLEEKDAKHNVVHFSAWDTENLTGENLIRDEEVESVEDMAVRSVMVEKLRLYMTFLADEEAALLTALCIDGKTVRQYSAETGIPNMTIHGRKIKALSKLKIFFEKK